MLITGQRIRTLHGRTGLTKRGSKIVVGAKLVPAMMKQLEPIGFSADAKIGDAVLPGVIGPITKFNAEGGVIVHRDKPKETAYRTVEWTWQEWHGPYDRVEKSDFRDVPYERYPRTKIAPPSIELKIAVTADGQRVLVAPPLTFNGSDDENLIHVVNLFLEILGACQLFRDDLAEIIKAPLRRLNWKLLPSGHRTWKQLRPDVLEVIKRAPKGNRPVIEHRLEQINRYGPDFVAVGQAGFAGYVVFGFSKKRLFVFESIYQDNATYIFGHDWERLSKLTKMEVLENKLYLGRIVHRRSWTRRMNGLLEERVGKAKDSDN